MNIKAFKGVVLELIASAVWWPRISANIEKYVQNCKERTKRKSPAKESDHSWQKVCTDLFLHNSKICLIAIDFFS